MDEIPDGGGFGRPAPFRIMPQAFTMMVSATATMSTTLLFAYGPLSGSIWNLNSSNLSRMSPGWCPASRSGSGAARANGLLKWKSWMVPSNSLKRILQSYELKLI